MLELRPTCENCDKPLPPDSTEAMICSFECTFCAACAHDLLANVCPNCGGGFERRPVRPRQPWVRDVSLARYPASGAPVHRPVDRAAHAALVARQQGMAPERR